MRYVKHYRILQSRKADGCKCRSSHKVAEEALLIWLVLQGCEGAEEARTVCWIQKLVTTSL